MADCSDQDRSDVKVKESDCTIEDEDDDYTSNESDLGEERDNPERYGYQILACDYNDDGEDSESDTDYPTPIHANNYFKPHCNFGSQYGDVHDEEVSPIESPTSSIDSWEEMGKVESSSKELYSSETAYMYGVNFTSRRPAAVTAGSQFDEEHSVPSSPELSPRQGNTRGDSLDYLRSMGGRRNKYSRYSTTMPTHTQVDDKIKFSLLQAPAGNSPEVDIEQFMSKPSDYMYTGFNSYGSFSQSGDFCSNFNDKNSQKTVRGMAVGGTITRPEHTTLEMEPNSQKFQPGRILHKHTSSCHTKDGEPILTNLDNSPYTRGSYTASADYARRVDTFGSASGPSNAQKPGYDSREYGERDSLEHQHPERESQSTRSHLAPGADSKSYDTFTSESTGERSEYNVRKEKKSKKMKKEQKVNTHQVEGYVGDKNLDEVLKFLGEDDTISTDKSKKKKDKKKKDVNKTEKRKTKDSGGSSSHQSKKKESQVSQKKETNTSKVKLGAKKETAASDVVNTPTSPPTEMNTNSKDSSIIQTTTEKGVVSQIVLDGFEERNIDEEIDKSLKNRSPDGTSHISKGDISSSKTSPTNRTEAGTAAEVHTALVGEHQHKSVGQTRDGGYNVDPGSFYIEKEFARVKTPEPVEEKFKQVTHKRKKGHIVKPPVIVEREAKKVPAASANPPRSSVKQNPPRMSSGTQRTEQKPKGSKKHDSSSAPSVPASIDYNKAMKQPTSSAVQDLASHSAFPPLSSDSNAKGAAVPSYSWLGKNHPSGGSSHASTGSVAVSPNSQPAEIDNSFSSVENNVFHNMTPSDISTDKDGGTAIPAENVNSRNKSAGSSVSRSNDNTASTSTSGSAHDHSIRTLDSKNISPNIITKSHDTSSELGQPTTKLQNSKFISDSSNVIVHEKIKGSKTSVHSNSENKTNKANTSGAKKSNIVEFLDQSAKIEESTGANINLDFGLNEEVLSQTSLGRQKTTTGPRVHGGSGDHKVKSEPVDVLKSILQADVAAIEASLNYGQMTPSLENNIEMVLAGWKAVEKELQAIRNRPAGHKGKPTVVYWSSQLRL